MRDRDLHACRRLACLGIAAVMMLGAAGCTTSPSRISEPSDPLEPFNRAVYRFNTDFDNAFLKPVAKGYRVITPDPVERGITNFYGNLGDVTSVVNNILQFKMSRAGSDVGRLFINSTVGVFGFFDVATNVGLPSYKEDFGQTLGYWGMDSGAFVMLPFLGPSSVRDTLGEVGDLFTDPLFNLEPIFDLPKDHVYWGLVALRYVDRRANYLATTDILEDAAIDPYVLLRDAYLQRRHYRVHDGNPPTIEGEEDFWDEIDFDG